MLAIPYAELPSVLTAAESEHPELILFGRWREVIKEVDGVYGATIVRNPSVNKVGGFFHQLVSFLDNTLKSRTQTQQVQRITRNQHGAINLFTYESMDLATERSTFTDGNH